MNGKHFEVAINGLLLKGRDTGGSEYTRQLVHHLAALAADVRVTCYVRADLSERDRNFLAGAHLSRVPLSAGNPVVRTPVELVFWRYMRSQLEGLDVFHSPFFYSLTPPEPTTLITVYDVRFLRYPETYRPLRRLFLRSVVPWSLHRADGVISTSQATKNELVQLLSLPPSKITVVPLAGAADIARVTSPAVLERVRVKYSLPESFVLAVGEMEPRKNYGRLIRAFARFASCGTRAPALVIAGQPGWEYRRLRTLVSTIGIAGRVAFLGYVPRSELAALYSLASVFVFPSMYEGFGLPVLEAMACGVPVAVADATALPEVAGDAAVTFDPLSVGDMADALHLLVANHTLREELIARGRARVQSFSWEQTAAATLQVYAQVAKRR